MTKKAKKMAVFDTLLRQHQAISLPELLALLPPGYAERSVRRWLAQLVEEGRVARSGRKRGTRYQAKRGSTLQFEKVGEPHLSEAIQYVPDDAQAIFSRASLEAIARIRQPRPKRKPVTYNMEWFDRYQPNLTSYLQTAEKEELARHGKRTEGQEPAGTYARHIYNRLLIDLSYHSSRLEGNTYSLIDTKRLLMEGVSATGKLDEEKVMILNHKEAIRHLVDRGVRLEVGYDEMLTLHYLLSEGLVPSQYAGNVRDHWVRIGASAYIPLADRKVLEHQLRAVAEKAAAIENPHEQSLFLLIHISYLQAFADVNKRTSRLCANIPLFKSNLVPLSFNAIEKDDYAAAMLAIYELQEPRPIMELYRASYLSGCAEYGAVVEASGFDEIRVRYRQQRRQAIREVIVNKITGKALQDYIANQAPLTVPSIHRENFVEDLREDLEEISPQRIAGLGITRSQLQDWLELTKQL